MAKAAIADFVMAVADFDSSISAHIRTLIQNEELKSIHGSLDAVAFKKEDYETEGSAKRKLKQILRMIRRVDSKQRYIGEAESFRESLYEALTIRNCIAHNRTSIWPRTVRSCIVLSRWVEEERAPDLIIRVPIRFTISPKELAALSKLMRVASMWMHWIVIEMMYDYTLMEREKEKLIHPPPTKLWPEGFRTPPYPWNEDLPLEWG